MARRMKWKECDVHALALTQQSYSSRHSGSESSSDTSSCGSSAVSHNSSGSSEQGGNPNDFEPLSWESQTFDPAHYGSRVRDADSDQAVWNNPNLEAAINAEQNKRNEDNEDDASDEDDASAKPSEQDLKKLTVVNLRKQLNLGPLSCSSFIPLLIHRTHYHHPRPAGARKQTPQKYLTSVLLVVT